MAKQPAKTAPRRAVRVTAPQEPRNQSRAAGAPAPASAAASPPYYAPADSVQPRTASLAPQAGPAPNPLRAAHSATVAERAVDDEQLTGAALDVEIAAHAHSEEPPANETLEQQIARIRTIRRPLGAYSQKLALEQRAGYHRHWFNDEGGRITDALNNGWSHVKDKDGKPTKRAVGSGRDKGVLFAYAMEIPKVFWEEDMAARHAVAAEKIAALKTSPAKADAARGAGAEKSDQGKFYNPSESAGKDFLEVEKR